MRFTLILPSRGRVGLLGQFIDSVKNMSDDLSQIEVLVVHDNDDSETRGFLDQLSKHVYGFVKYWSVPQSLNFSKDYYNFLASKATGEWIVCCNDDARIETPHWDTLAFEILKDKPRVIYGYIEDGLGGAKARGGGEYCCFPLQGMKGVHAMGFVFPTRIPCWGADMWARNLYDQIGSTVKLPIKFMHYCHHNRTRPQDEVSRKIAQTQVAYSVRPDCHEVEALISALNGQVPTRMPETKPQPKPINYRPAPGPRPVMPQPKPWVKKKVWMSV